MNSIVSLILPIYKAREDWLAQCLASIKAQTYKDIELVRIDDVAGAWAARNKGLDAATGEYIAFCDADDYLEPHAIRDMVDHMGFGADMICGSFRKFGDFEQVVTHPTAMLGVENVAVYVMGNLLNPRSNQMLSGCWAKLYRRNLCGRFPDLTTAEDVAFNFDYLKRCFAVRFISDIVYHNRKHSDSLTTTFDAGDKAGLFGFLGGLKYVKRFLDHHYPEEAVCDALDNSKVYHSMLYAQRIGPDAFMKVFP